MFKSRLDQLKMNSRNGKYFDGREPIYLFHVIEYQYRGLPHAHLVAHLKDAPDITDQNHEDLINFVDSHFVAELPRFEGEEHQNVYTKKHGKWCLNSAYTESKLFHVACKGGPILAYGFLLKSP